MFRFVLVFLFISNSFSQSLQLPLVGDLQRVFSLPNVFESFETGELIETKEDWESKRKPELKELFQYYIYGYFPEHSSIQIINEIKIDNILDGLGSYEEYWIQTISQDENAPIIKLGLFIPYTDKEDKPIWLTLNKCGNQTLISDVRIPFYEKEIRSQGCTVERTARGAHERQWDLKKILANGYIFATFEESDIKADDKNFEDGLYEYFKNVRDNSLAPFGVITAWSWGLSRAIDALQEIREVNHLLLFGHSRRGKTALLTAAFDERVDVVVPHQSGTAGAALSRYKNILNEFISRIVRRFGHWFTGRFGEFSRNASRLPIDQHMLMALVAPRGIIVTEGTLDVWSNPGGSKKALRYASPIYDEFYGIKLGQRYVIPTWRRENRIQCDGDNRLYYVKRMGAHAIHTKYVTPILKLSDCIAEL